MPESSMSPDLYLSNQLLPPRAKKFPVRVTRSTVEYIWLITLRPHMLGDVTSSCLQPESKSLGKFHVSNCSSNARGAG